MYVKVAAAKRRLVEIRNEMMPKIKTISLIPIPHALIPYLYLYTIL